MGIPINTMLEWYEEHARDLPWRRPEATPWAVLVSEVMLQQTPVVRVLPVFEEWMQRWPTPETLADAAPGDAVRVWGRLGYPRRALRLHECATVVDNKHGGVVPSDVTDLLALPGIGAYTARAVAAFAYRQRCAPVDVNVRRVLARVLGGAGDDGSATSAADFRRMEALLPDNGEEAARFSVAVMELGATVCTRRSPRCSECPIASDCVWRDMGYPAYDGPRRTQSYDGTDRQARGRLLALLRDAPEPVPVEAFEPIWPLAVQRERALASLLKDGLVVRTPQGGYTLP